MPSQWLALKAGDDSRAHARRLRQSWERLLAARELKSESPAAAGALRQPIVDSWRRSLDTGLDPAGWLAPIEADPAEVRERWLEHPLGSLARVLNDQLETIAEDLQSLIVVSDATGLLLYLHGPEWLKERAADEMAFLEGARWSEAAAGTNAIGTALAEDHPLQVFAFEHFNPREHRWTCSAAPIHDPTSGRVAGIVDLTGPWKTVHPASLPLVARAARTMEQCLGDARRDRDARLRRRYGDLATRTADLLVSGDGHVLAGDYLNEEAGPLAIPAGGGEVILGDGSRANAEPLGHGEAYLVRSTVPRGLGARGGGAATRQWDGHEVAGSAESSRPGGDSDQWVRAAYLATALDCVIMADRSGRVVEFNPAAERTFGYRREEALGRTIAELIVPPPLRDRHTAAFARFIETGEGRMLGRRLEMTGMRADGSEFPVELALTRVEGDPPLICGALRDISSAKRAERHLRELADEQAALRRVATLVARESSPQQLFASVAEQVARIIDVPLVRLVRYEQDGSAVQLIGGWGEKDPLGIGTHWRIDGGPGVLASVWESGRPARLDDYTDLPGKAAAVVRQAGMRSAVASPITVEGRLWGAISVLSPRQEPLPESTEVRLADFTELVATALANAESRGELAASEARARKLAEEQAALRRIATLVAQESSPDVIFAVVAEEVGQVLCVPLVGLFRYETDGAAMRVVGGWSERAFPVPMGTRLLLDGPSHFADVWATGCPARLEDPTDLPGEIAAAMRQAGVGSGAASPILVEGRIWGAMGMGLFGSSDRLPDDIEPRLSDFTELVSTSIANSEARDSVRVLAEEQASLRRVATLVAEGATADVLFAAVAREVAGLFGVGMVSIDRYENGESVVLASLGVPEFPVGSRWPLDGPGVRALVYETGRPARVDDFSEVVGKAPAVARAHGIESAVGCPIVVDGKVWGVLGIGARQSETLAADVERQLGAFTELVSTAIANSDARDQVSRLLDEQSALRRVATLVAEGASAGELFSAVAQEVAGVIGLPVVGVHRYEPDATFTMVGVAGDTTFTVGSRWPVEDEGLAGMILASGRPARKDDYSTMPGRVGAAVRHDRMASMVGVPIVADGGVWGFMVAGGGPGEPIPAGTEEHLARFTELVATAVSNATMSGDLAASRARVIATADETRRRIERDLHDGAQQQLVTLALRLRAAEEKVPVGLDDLRTEVGRSADRLTSVLDELREMSRGIHPAILTEGGLSPAIEALALRSVVPVKLNVRCERRLPENVEVAAYYVVSEGLTNAAKHAEASCVEVDLHAEATSLYLAIHDDGIGGADPDGGSGLLGLKDRVEALGGTLEVATPSGGGTRLDVAIPLVTETSIAPGSLSMPPA